MLVYRSVNTPESHDGKGFSMILCILLGTGGNFQGRFTVKRPGSKWVIWVFPKIGVPQNGWFKMENPIKMDDLGVPPFKETPIWEISAWETSGPKTRVVKFGEAVGLYQVPDCQTHTKLPAGIRVWWRTTVYFSQSRNLVAIFMV